MPKSKNKKMIRNSPRPKSAVTASTPKNSATAPAAVYKTNMPQGKTTPTAGKQAQILVDPGIGTELKVVGILTFIILAAIIILAVVLH